MNWCNAIRAALAGGVLALAATAVSAQDTIKIGVIAEFSGPFADYGKEIEGGMKAYLKQHGNTFRLRTLDALQLAVALDVHRRESLDAVVAADNALCQVGAAEGLPVINPEVPS